MGFCWDVAQVQGISQLDSCAIAQFMAYVENSTSSSLQCEELFFKKKKKDRKKDSWNQISE